LKNGDHLNVLMYVCYAAQGSDQTPSFAKQVADEFAKHGISTSVVASVKPVDRIGNIENGDVAGQLLRFRANQGDIRILNTTVSPQKEIVQQTERLHPDAFIISRFGSGPQRKIEGNMFEFLQRKDLQQGDHRRYAGALAYFMKGNQKSGPSRADAAKHLFLQLENKDRRLVANQLKDIDSTLYRKLQLTVRDKVIIGSQWQRRPAEKKPLDTDKEPSKGPGFKS